MMPIAVELLRAGGALAIFLVTLRAGRRFALGGDPGWRLVTVGFGLLALATAWDVTDNFNGLSAYVIVGKTGAQAFIEKAVGYLGGLAFLFLGFRRWLPLTGKTKAARGELAALNRDLEARVAERTAELERVSRAKSAFLARMSHELRTPLNAVIGLSEIMARQAGGPVEPLRQVEYAKSINRSGRHLLAMVEEILDLSKIEAGKMQLEEAPVDLAALGEEAVSMLRVEAERVGVALGMRREGESAAVLADAQRLRQILLNLLSNAIKFTPSGGRVTLGVDIDAEGRPRLEVADTGIGMSPEDLARVGEPFVQGAQLEARRSPGTGLGLVLVGQLAELHGGSFSLASTPGEGTVATVTLPPARRLPEEGRPADARRGARAAPGATLAPGRDRGAA